MKINMILPALGHSGGTQMALNYLEYFSENGHDIVCYVPIAGAYYGWKKILFPKAIFRLIKSPDLQGKWFDNKFQIKFVPYINNLFIRNADISIATSWITSYWVNNLSKAKGKKVYFIQDFETWGDEKENQKVRKSYQLPFDLRITVSTELHNRLLREVNARSTVVCNGISEKYIAQSKKLVSNNITIGMVFREKRAIEKDIKNIKFGINSLIQFSQQSPNIKLKVFGFEKPRHWNKHISFLENPSRKQIFNWYDTVDIFYVPSLYEGWGLPAMEAMARGCVVVAANTGCIYEYGQDKVNCIKLENMQSTTELFKAFDEIIASNTLRERISHNAVKTVLEYSFENQAEKFLKELKKLR